MSDFMNNLNKVGMILQAGGGSLAGRDGMAVVREYQAQQEDERRKAAIAGLLQQSGIGGVQRGLIEQLPVGEQAPVILNMLAQMEAQRRAGGAAGAAAAREAAAQEARMAQWQALTGGGQAAAAPGGFSLGESLTDVPAPSAPLSFGLPSAMPQAMPAPPTMPMSFGEIVPSAPPPPPSPYNMYRRALEQAYTAPPGAIDPQVIKDLEERVKFFAPPETVEPTAEMRNLEFRAQQAGLVPGTEDYAQFMLTGGSQNGLVIESDGQGGFRMAQGVPAGTTRPFTEAQSKDNVFATRAIGALEVLEPVAQNLTSLSNRAAELDPTGTLRQFQTSEFQVAQQAGEEFLQAILRKDTGAAITADEQFLYGRTFLPRPGDGPEVLEAKRVARQRAVSAIRAGMSPAQILATERALGEVPVAELPPQEGPQPVPQPEDRPASSKFAEMNLDQLLNNIPTTEAEAAEWNKRYEALGGQ